MTTNISNSPKIKVNPERYNKIADIYERYVVPQAKKGREEVGKTQKEIAEYIGVTQMCISLFERGMLNSAVILTWYILHDLISI